MKRLISSIVALVVMLSLVAVPAALAQQDVTGVTGTLPAASLEVTAPTDITLVDTLYGTGNVIGSSTDGSVLCYGVPSLGYTLKIKSDNSTGKMYSGANKLAAPLLVTAVLEKGTGADVTSGGTLTDVVVTTSEQTVGSTSEPAPTADGKNDITLSVSQARQTAGVAGTYSLTLTFTATAN